jgi:hypothetical protein
MMLNLSQPIIYHSSPFGYTSAQDAYESLLSYLDSQEVGSEGCIALTSIASPLFVGCKEKPSEAELLAIERAELQPVQEGSHHLPAGRYEFLQLAPTKELSTLLDQLPITIDGPARTYVRLLKEGPLAIVAQLWIER